MRNTGVCRRAERLSVSHRKSAPLSGVSCILGKSYKVFVENSTEETSWKAHTHGSTMLRWTLNKQRVCGMDSSGSG
jgi:hypothetical protein